MAKVIDISEKLTFGENPRIVINGEELEVRADAATVLKMMGIISGDQPTVQEVLQCMDLLLSKEDRKKLDSMKLSFKDFMTVIYAAMDLAAGLTEEDAQGEEESRTMT